MRRKGDPREPSLEGPAHEPDKTNRNGGTWLRATGLQWKMVATLILAGVVAIVLMGQAVPRKAVEILMVALPAFRGRGQIGR